MPCALEVTDRRPQSLSDTQCDRLGDHISNSSFSKFSSTKGHTIQKPEKRDITFATLSPRCNSDWKLVPFLSDIQDINKRSYFTSGTAGTESFQFPWPIIFYWLDYPNEKNMHDQIDHSKTFSSGSPPPGITLKQCQHRRKIKKPSTVLPPCNVLVNNSSKSVAAPVRSDSDILHDDGKAPRKNPKKKRNNKKGKHFRRGACKRLNLSSEIHCEENIDAASPVEVLTDLLVDKLSETSSSAGSLVKEAHFGEDNGGKNNEYVECRTKLNPSTLGSADMDGSGCTGSSTKTVGDIFSCKGVKYLIDGSNNSDNSEFLGSTFTEDGCPSMGKQSSNYEKSLCACVCNSNDATIYSMFNKLERDNTVNCSANNEVSDSCHPIGAHLSASPAEDSNGSFGSSSCCSKDVADSSSHTERVKCSSEACSSKTSLPVVPGRSRKKSRKTSNYGYLTATSGILGTNKNKHSGKYSSTSVWQKVEKLNVENTCKAVCMVDSGIQNKNAFENISKGTQHSLTRSMTTHNQSRKMCNQPSPDERIEMEHAKENDALNSYQEFSRYKHKKQTPFLYQQTGLSSNQGIQPSVSYHDPKNGIAMVPKNHFQQKNGLPMMQLIHDKDSSVATGVSSNCPAEGNGSSQSGVEKKAALASCNMNYYCAPQATYKETCKSTIQEDPHSSSTENEAISTNSNSRNMCVDPCPAEREENCHVKLTTENTPKQFGTLYSASGKCCKLYSAAAHVSQKWVAVSNKNIVQFNGSETSVDASVLTNGIPVSANFDVGANIPNFPASADNGINKLASEISDILNSSEHLDLRCQPCTDTSTDFKKIRQAVCDAHMAQQRVENVQVIFGRPLADFERFICSASPVLYCSTCPAGKDFCSQEWIKDGMCFHQSTNITLSRIWQWYEEPCCYGLEVKAQDFCRSKGLWNSRDQFTTYFVPYLSAVQLFGQAKRASTRRVDKEAAGMDVTSKISPCMSSLPILAKLLPQQLHETSSPSDLHTKCDQHGELIFEFFESEPPFSRRQLFEKINELISGVKPSNCQISGDPKSLELSLRDLHPTSWYCVAWYPIYRIPDGKFQAAFLTYHSLGHWILEGTSEQAGHTRAVLPVIGLQSYNDKGEWWFEVSRSSAEEAEWTEEESAWSEASQAVKERVRTLNEAAGVMSSANVVKEQGMCRNRHPDYGFFLSRQPRR
ncbi:uncharacterized protein LOC102702575 isoform X2 [Oryza brachyantha]|uniref:Uncharacterized protein n=2 Tax=Oryza brachyantha TaxID=4533 RepID=J3MHV3_ORYBR|nr:uncharacterized protein LOC102702575 isoform X2 [Oryza brachyantha]XP_040380713.1 uncharacterized protein LOC102702575 isoform X2 [Oryza brachyantha]